MNLRPHFACLMCLAITLVLHGAMPRPLLAAPSAQATALDAARAVVRIRGCNIQGCHQGVGSGVFIDPSGLVLTAHHVTLSDALNPLSQQLSDFVIEVTDNPRQAPTPLYRARVVAQNPSSDLALLQIYWNEQAGRALDAGEVDLPYMRLADPDSIQFGEELAIFGYPLAGGHSINYASEGLSGFDADDGGSLLKVQKSLSEGNSGGPALVQRPDGYAIAGVVIERRGTMGEVGLIRSIGELHDLEWAAGGRRAVVGSAAMSQEQAPGDSMPVVCLDSRLFDLAGHSIRLLAYAYDGASQLPYRVSDPRLPTTAGGQLVLAAEVAPAEFIERMGSRLIQLDSLPSDLASAGLVYRLALWDVNTGQLLWSDSHWRQPQVQTQSADLASCIAAAVPGAERATAAPPSPAADTPAPANTPTLSPTAVPTETSTPTVTPTATATPVPQRCSVQVDSLNLRRGPGPAYVPPLATVSNRSVLLPLGRSDDSTWILVQVEDSGQEGWVSANPSYVACDMPIADLPPVAPPPTPVPPTPLPVTPTPPPTPTSAAPLQVGVSASTGSGNYVNTFGGGGQTVYSDRGYTYSETPGALAGMFYIQTANNDREHRDGDFWLNLDVNKPVRVYVAYSDAYTEKPGWLQSFGDTGLDLRFVDAMGRTVTLSVFSQQFPAGKITLGANTPRSGDTHTMYTVFVAEDHPADH
jgi:hypothetical protein